MRNLKAKTKVLNYILKNLDFSHPIVADLTGDDNVTGGVGSIAVYRKGNMRIDRLAHVPVFGDCPHTGQFTLEGLAEYLENTEEDIVEIANDFNAVNAVSRCYLLRKEYGPEWTAVAACG